MGLPQIFSRNGQCTISINCKEQQLPGTQNPTQRYPNILGRSQAADRTDRCTQEKPVCYNPIAGNLQGRICAGAAQPDNILDAQNENQYVNAQLIDAMYSEKWKNKVLLIEGVLLPDWGY